MRAVTVLRDIEELLPNLDDAFNALNFEPVEYQDEKGENCREQKEESSCEQ